MTAAPTIRQRMVLRRRPRAFAIGTTRRWSDGTYVKTGPSTWARQRAVHAGGQLPQPSPRKILEALPEAALKERGGLVELTRALERAASSQVKSFAQEAVNQMSTWDVAHPPLLLDLPAAMAALMTTGAGPWFLYCARRSAAFNGGRVDLGTLDRHVERARALHKDVIPEMAKAYSGPKTVADVNLWSWQQFFAEGGQLNQPAWLESGRLKELRRQFELLANMHR